jgi:Uma2 family endonuclease
MTVLRGNSAILAHAELQSALHAEHRMGMPAPIKRRWTARAVRDLIASEPRLTPRYELVDGELLVTPSPRYVHQKTVAVLMKALIPYVEKEGLGWVLTSPSDVELEPEFLSQPDVFVVPADEDRRMMATDEHAIRRLLLVTEVLSRSSRTHDREVKRPKYQRCVPVYWIIDLDARVVEQWSPSAIQPEIVATTLVWHPAEARAPFALDLPAYFDKIFGHAPDA